MNYYQITFNNFEGFEPNDIHKTITENLGVADWWHYLPSVYIVETASTSYFLSNKIIAAHPGLSFIITKIYLDDWNGYLNKRAWEWLGGKIKTSSLSSIKYVPFAPSPLKTILKDYKAPQEDAVKALMEILKQKK